MESLLRRTNRRPSKTVQSTRYMLLYHQQSMPAAIAHVLADNVNNGI